MNLHFRYRAVAPIALAISSLGLIGFVGTASAASTPSKSKGAETSAAHANANAGKDEQASSTTNDAAAPAAGPAVAASTSPSSSAVHDASSGPGGQVCDGDPSTKSDTGSGANGGYNNYDHQCGGPSLNGNGGGQASGRPCAGCVGNADDKNPPGQFADGSDHNHGYECDPKGAPNGGNRGVGVGNPAHTGCPTTSNDCIPTDANHHCDTDCVPSTSNNNCGKCPDGSTPPANGKCGSSDCVPTTANHNCGKVTTTETCPDGLRIPADGKCDQTPVVHHDSIAPQVLGEEFVRADVAPAAVAPTVAAAAVAPAAVAPAALARTGADISGMVRLAMLLTFAGLGLVLATRLRRDEEMISIASRLGGW